MCRPPAAMGLVTDSLPSPASAAPGSVVIACCRGALLLGLPGRGAPGLLTPLRLPPRLPPRLLPRLGTGTTAAGGGGDSASRPPPAAAPPAAGAPSASAGGGGGASVTVETRVGTASGGGRCSRRARRASALRTAAASTAPTGCQLRMHTCTSSRLARCSVARIQVRSMTEGMGEPMAGISADDAKVGALCTVATALTRRRAAA